MAPADAAQVPVPWVGAVTLSVMHWGDAAALLDPDSAVAGDTWVASRGEPAACGGLSSH